MKEKTFIMIKPDAVESGHVGNIIAIFEANNFQIIAVQSIVVSRGLAADHYYEHKQKPFYGELVDSFAEKQVVAMILEKENAIADARTLIGATDPAQAEEGTIRKLYAQDKGRNAVHGSDSAGSAEREIDLWFSLGGSIF